MQRTCRCGCSLAITRANPHSVAWSGAPGSPSTDCAPRVTIDSRALQPGMLGQRLGDEQRAAQAARLALREPGEGRRLGRIETPQVDDLDARRVAGSAFGQQQCQPVGVILTQLPPARGASSTVDDPGTTTVQRDPSAASRRASCSPTPPSSANTSDSPVTARRLEREAGDATPPRTAAAGRRPQRAPTASAGCA